MSWLRTSPLRASFSRQLSRPIDAGAKCDPSACYESFCKHWQQAEEIIQRSTVTTAPTQDDVLGVVSHLDHLVTLLLLEIRHSNSSTENADTSNLSGGACLEHLLSENLLNKLYEWGSCTGRYLNTVRFEQMNLYSLLVTHSGQQLLCAEPFLRPLLKLLSSFRGELLPIDIEGRLVCLLGQLCVVLMEHTRFVDLFFFTTPDDPDKKNTNFVPVTLLLTFVHHEGPLGQQARAALLLCAALSNRNQAVAEFIANRSNVCPILATGQSGLYSSLPRNIDVSQPDWHRLTPDDVNDINKLALFMNSLEFCNAVIRVAHPLIQKQLIDFLYQGFLLPVMGPALLQTKRPGSSTTRDNSLQTGVNEQIAAIAYFELALRSVTDPGLLQTLVRFLLDDNYDGSNILDMIVPLIDREPRLSMVTISLLETLVDLNCEDLMIELILKYLIGGNHLMVSHRRRSLGCDIHCRASNMFLTLSPECCTTKPLTKETPGSRRNSNASSRKPSLTSLDQSINSLTVSERGSASVSRKNHPQACAYGLNTNESLYGNYHAYLCEARRKISSCKNACKKWSSKYDGHSCSNIQTDNVPFSNKLIITVVKDFQLEHSNLIKETSFVLDSTENDEGIGELSSNMYTTTNKEEDSLQSIGESSGYESFKYRSDDHHGTVDDERTLTEIDSSECTEDSFWKSPYIVGRISDPTHLVSKKAAAKDGNNSRPVGDVNIGPLLRFSLLKLSKMLENDVYVNLRLTGLLTRLATYPMPLLRSFLLCPWIVLQPTVTSLYQILVSLKQSIDEGVRTESDRFRLVEEAQIFLIDREIRLTNARKNAIESSGMKSPDAPRNNVPLATQFTHHGVQYHNIADVPSQPNSGAWDQQPSNVQPLSINEQQFKRNEPKRKSFSSSFTSMFSRKMNSGGISGSPTNSHHPPIESATHYTRQPESQPSYSTLTEENLWQSTFLRKVILNAVILDEWLRELGALAQEHVVCSIADYMNSTNCEQLDSSTAQAKIL